jgi:hypothetical protein
MKYSQHYKYTNEIKWGQGSIGSTSNVRLIYLSVKEILKKAAGRSGGSAGS